MAQDLSLGSLLLAADTLSVLGPGLDPLRRGEWERARTSWEAAQAAHPGGLSAKARAELPHRLNLWKAYLQDLAEKPADASAYAVEVRHRVLLDRLADVAGGRPDPSPARALEAADRTLRSWMIAGPFVWAPPLVAAYPRQRFWYLYGLPSPTPSPG